MNIVFTGYRNSGKTTLSRLLSGELDWSRLETDSEIEKEYELSIPHIIEIFGWNHFRKTEARVLRKAALFNHSIIDTGGGAVLHPAEMKILKRNAIVIYLSCSVDTLYKRALEGYKRPPLSNTGLKCEISTCVKERDPLYRKYADTIIDNNDISIEEAVSKIAKEIIFKFPGTGVNTGALIREKLLTV